MNMGKKYIIIGAEHKDSQYCGAYIFERKDGFEFRKTETRADLEFAKSGTNLTPRLVACNQGNIYVMTDRDLWEFPGEAAAESYEEKKTLTLNQPLKSLTEIIADAEKRTQSRKEAQESLDPSTIIGKNTCGSIAFLGEEMLLAVYAADKMKEDENQVVGGCLLHSSTGKWEDLTRISGYAPTGEITINEESRTILLPSKGELLELKIAKGKGDVSSIKNLTGNILSAAHKGRITVCTDNLDGYLIGHGERSDQWEKYEPVDKPKHNQFEDRKYLPSCAASVAILEPRGDPARILFGCDNGKLLVYKVTGKNQDQFGLSYEKTISFMSPRTAIRSADKDDYIRNIKVEPGNDYVSFTLRNLYMRMSAYNLILLSPEKRITEEEEKVLTEPTKTTGAQSCERGEYLQKLKDTYALEQICATPHRITSYDYFTLRKEGEK